MVDCYKVDSDRTDPTTAPADMATIKTLKLNEKSEISGHISPFHAKLFLSFLSCPHLEPLGRMVEA